MEVRLPSSKAMNMSTSDAESSALGHKIENEIRPLPQVIRFVKNIPLSSFLNLLFHAWRSDGRTGMVQGRFLRLKGQEINDAQEAIFVFLAAAAEAGIVAADFGLHGYTLMTERR
jgi:hypothetical protein